MLQDVQEAYGYIPEPVLYFIAERMNIYPSHIFGVITFYSQFKLKPAGKYIVKVCVGTACHVKGSERVSKELHELLKVKVGDTTDDGRFTFEEVACRRMRAGADGDCRKRRVWKGCARRGKEGNKEVSEISRGVVFKIPLNPPFSKGKLSLY